MLSNSGHLGGLKCRGGMAHTLTHPVPVPDLQSLIIQPFNSAGTPTFSDGATVSINVTATAGECVVSFAGIHRWTG